MAVDRFWSARKKRATPLGQPGPTDLAKGLGGAGTGHAAGSVVDAVAPHLPAQAAPAGADPRRLRRVQVGLAGVLGVLLLVGLASLVSQPASDGAAVPGSELTGAPLGVPLTPDPAAPPAASASASARTAGAAADSAVVEGAGAATPGEAPVPDLDAVRAPPAR